MGYKEQMDIINQTINDTKYLKDNYKPSRGLIKVIRTWFLMYTISEFIFYIINGLNLKYQLYLYDWYFTLYNSFIFIVCLFIVLSITIYVNKINITYKERDILKGWLIFPILFSLIEILPIISIFLNSDVASDFYNAFPITLLLTLIMIVFIYYQYKYKELKIIIVANCILIALVFTSMSLMLKLHEVTELQAGLVFLFNEFLSYKGCEIITILITLLMLKRRLRYE